MHNLNLDPHTYTKFMVISMQIVFHSQSAYSECWHYLKASFRYFLFHLEQLDQISCTDLTIH